MLNNCINKQLQHCLQQHINGCLEVKPAYNDTNNGLCSLEYTKH